MLSNQLGWHTAKAHLGINPTISVALRVANPFSN
nr:MAG TPA: hypothetical protein [Caudoviricetes sp.]